MSHEGHDHEHEHQTEDEARGHEGHEHMTEEEMRARLEEELRRITVPDVLLQTIVSLVNLGGQRLGLTPDTEDMRDLEQARFAIEGVRALLPILEELDAEQMKPVRDALSQLQMAYAQIARAEGAADVGGGPAGPAGGGAPGGSGTPGGDAPPRGPAQGPAPPPDRGGLWVPPGTK